MRRVPRFCVRLMCPSNLSAQRTCKLNKPITLIQACVIHRPWSQILVPNSSWNPDTLHRSVCCATCRIQKLARIGVLCHHNARTHV